MVPKYALLGKQLRSKKEKWFLLILVEKKNLSYVNGVYVKASFGLWAQIHISTKLALFKRVW